MAFWHCVRIVNLPHASRFVSFGIENNERREKQKADSDLLDSVPNL